MKLSSHSIYSCWVRLASSDFYLHLHADDFQICFVVKIFLLTFKISLKKVKMKVLVTQSCLTLCNPLDCSLTGSSVHGDSPGTDTGVGGHSLLQRIFPTQGMNPGLLHCRQILYSLSQQESPG